MAVPWQEGQRVLHCNVKLMAGVCSGERVCMCVSVLRVSGKP